MEKFLAPNGKPSNLNSEQYKLVRTPAFKEWFGDWEKLALTKQYDSGIDEISLKRLEEGVSKVVDENGEPLVVYRGNKEAIGYQFELGLNFLNKNNVNNFGFFFTDNLDVAKSYKSGSLNGIILSVFLNLKKIIDLKSLGFQTVGEYLYDFLNKNNISLEGFEELKDNIINYDRTYDKIDVKQWYTPNIYDFFDNFPELRNVLIENKINGVIFKEKSRSYFGENTYVALEPNQIKLADGTNTTFDSNNLDIRFEKGGNTIAQTPAVKSEQIYGSDVNKKGSSKDLQNATKIEFSDKTLVSIINKVNEHNKKHPNKKITLESAKAVVRRGMGAYSKSHRPTISEGKPNNRVAWGLARLNAFLYKIVNGKSKSGKYSQDNDLIKELGYKVQKYEIGGVFQGTRHDFNAYSTEYIGTGEGNQVFGWGLYFTDVKDIARYYMSAGLYDDEQKIMLNGKSLSKYKIQQEVKDQLVGIVDTIFGEDKMIPTINSIKGYLVLEYDEENYPELKELVELCNKTYDFIKDKKLSFIGNIYYVTLFKGKNPNDYELLNWEEKPKKEHIDLILNQLEKEKIVIKKDLGKGEKSRFKGEALTKIFNNEPTNYRGGTKNSNLYTELSSFLGGDKEASLFLLRAGINGIKYEAGTLSGFEDKEGFNYVIFDANDITIEGKEKYDEIMSGKEKYADGGEADEPTHFWGTEAGGVLVYCSTTERYLILLKSDFVLEPNTWGIISGNLDDDETNVEDVVLREAEEETGQKLSDLIPSFIFEKPNFKFHNFVSIIEEEFVPELNWENTNYKWVKLNEIPENLHFGLKILLQKEDLPTLVEKNKNTKNKNQMDKNSFNTPLLIRLFELMREEVKSDVALHEIVENIMEIRSKGTLTMSDYDSIIGNVLNSEDNQNTDAVEEEKMAEGGKVESIHSSKGDIKLSLEENWYSDDTDVELVPVSELIKFREFDRKVSPKYNKENSVDNINHLKFMFQKDGVKSPLIIEYSKEDNAVLIIEGNHRLNSAIDLGMEYLPARVVLKKHSKFSKSQLKNAMKVSGVEGDQYGYIPSNMKPSKVGIQGTKSLVFGDGGIIEGRLHSECGDDGCGRKFQVGENGHVIEAERDEAVIVADAFDDNEKYTIKGTPSEVASALNVMGGGKNFDKGASIIKKGQELEIPELKKEATDTDVEDVIDSGSIIINRRSMYDKKEYEVTGTPKQIASAINSINGNGVVIEKGAEIK